MLKSMSGVHISFCIYNLVRIFTSSLESQQDNSVQTSSEELGISVFKTEPRLSELTAGSTQP